MQVRNIEFQETFGRVTVEGARQQHLLQRGPEVARQLGAREASDMHAINSSRTMPATEAEGRIVDPAEGRQAGRRSSRDSVRRNRAPVQPSNEGGAEGPGASGSRIDVVA